MSVTSDAPTPTEALTTSPKLYLGVGISITGNILISIALNIQKYSHNKNEKLNTPVPYVKRPLWWLGIILMITGEVGNFFSYGFAPSSVVAPLGTVGLISNAIIAPFALKEKFRVQDGIGVLMAIAGAVVVVIFSDTKSKSFGEQDLLDALRSTQFIIYASVTLSVLVILMLLSPKYGPKYLALDMLILGILTGYTVSSTKAVSSLMESGFVEMFKYWIMYVMVVVLVVTGAMQVRYLQKGLEHFDSTEVIPMQFVMYTVFAILSGGVLFGDFDSLETENFILFVLGVGLTYAGVFLISKGRKELRDEEQKKMTEHEDIEMSEQLDVRVEEEPQSPPENKSLLDVLRSKLDSILPTSLRSQSKFQKLEGDANGEAHDSEPVSLPLEDEQIEGDGAAAVEEEYENGENTSNNFHSNSSNNIKYSNGTNLPNDDKEDYDSFAQNDDTKRLGSFN